MLNQTVVVGRVVRIDEYKNNKVLVYLEDTKGNQVPVPMLRQWAENIIIFDLVGVKGRLKGVGQYIEFEPQKLSLLSRKETKQKA